MRKAFTSLEAPVTGGVAPHWHLASNHNTESRDFFCGPVTQFERSIGLFHDYESFRTICESLDAEHS